MGASGLAFGSHAPGCVPLFLLALLVVGCRKPYRVGEYVLVEWEEGTSPYPAYIIEKKTEKVYRVHFDGYESRWDEDIALDHILSRVEGPVNPPPPPKKVARAAGLISRVVIGDGQGPKAVESATAAPYKPGDRVKVRWRDSVYNATIVAVAAADKFLVHYDSYEAAWDETIAIDRIVSRR